MTATDFPTLQAFEAEARRRGFDEVVERSWPAGMPLDMHTHDFAVWAQVKRGEMWLVVAGESRHLPAGTEFTLDAGVPHTERYGADGATYWAARRHSRA